MDITEAPAIDVDRVAALLRESHVSHEASKAARKKGDRAWATVSIESALVLREQAHALDPEHTAPIWAEEQAKTPRGKDTHSELLAFYRQQLNPEVA